MSWWVWHNPYFSSGPPQFWVLSSAKVYTFFLGRLYMQFGEKLMTSHVEIEVWESHFHSQGRRHVKQSGHKFSGKTLRREMYSKLKLPRIVKNNRIEKHANNPVSHVQSPPLALLQFHFYQQSVLTMALFRPNSFRSLIL